MRSLANTLGRTAAGHNNDVRIMREAMEKINDLTPISRSRRAEAGSFGEQFPVGALGEDGLAHTISPAGSIAAMVSETGKEVVNADENYRNAQKKRAEELSGK
jgi:hypothetical protein